MKAQELNSDIKMELIEIGHEMNQAGLPKNFITNAVTTAFEFEGVYDLMKLWLDETDEGERQEIVADIQDMIDDCSQKEKLRGHIFVLMILMKLQKIFEPSKIISG